MEKILTKKTFPKWVKKLDTYEIYTPILKDNTWSYELIQDAEALDLDSLNPNTTIVEAPKKIILPQRETLLEFSTAEDGTPKIKASLPEMKPTIILGVRPCDAKAVSLSDKVFGGEYTDSYYFNRRNQTILIGLTCLTPPSPNCFCTSVGGSPHSQEGLDLLLTDMGDKYHINAITKMGEQLLKSAPELFKTPNAEEKSGVKKLLAESEKNLKRNIAQVTKISEKLKDLFDSPLWDEEAMSCLRCGICTYLCPTCHCFDITDEVTSSSPLNGKRVRVWDNCQFPDFTMHSSGHNPRPDKASRLRQRIMHKFRYFVEIHQNYQCTGCGRCTSLCPVGIDIIDVLEKVRDYG